MEDKGADDFDSFVAARERVLLGYALLLTADHHAAEDLLQVSLTKLFLSWSTVGAERAEPWVRRVMINANISMWRRTRGRERSDGFVPDKPGLHDTTAVVEQRDELRQALRQLSPRQRTAVVLRHYAGLSESETAVAMSCSIGTVKSQTSRGLSTLKAYLHSSNSRIGVHT